MTDYSELVDQGRIKRGRFARRQVEDCLRLARRDLETAQTVLAASPEWAFNIAYNAMHQTGRAFMFHAGYRTAGEGHHATVIRFLEIALGSKYQDVLSLLDRMRRKRNRATYDLAGTIIPPGGGRSSLRRARICSGDCPPPGLR
jgi:uncharacterized protein (UPF0332 family)